QAENLGYALVANEIRHAVAAQEEDVLWQQFARSDLGLDGLLDADGTGKHVGTRIPGGGFPIHQPSGDEFFNESVL
ncbi:MAG: hypothetical protein C4340_08145, partial [Armatimonadota bacterium]